MAVIVINKVEKPENFQDTGRTREWLVNAKLGSKSTAILENFFEPGGFVPAHYHPCEEVLICLEGTGTLIANNETFEFQEGSTAVIPAEEIHEVRNTGETRMRMLGVFPIAKPTGVWV